MVEKPVFAVLETVRFFAIAAAITAFASVATWMWHRMGGAPVSLRAAAMLATSTTSYVVVLGLVAAVSTRRVMVRLMDMKVKD